MNPVSAPYRAYESDRLHRELRERYDFHHVFLEQQFTEMQWASSPVPREMPWEVLPQSRLKPLLKRIGWLRRANRGVARRLSELDPHVVWLHGYDAPALWIARRWALRRGRPILYRADSNIACEEAQGLNSLRMRLKGAVIRRYLGAVDAFITIGSASEAYYAHFGADPRRFFRANYGIETPLFTRLADEQRAAGQPLRRELGITQPRVLLYVGRLVPVKDVPVLLRAFESVAGALPDVALVLIGTGPLKSEFEALAQRLDGRVYLPGFMQPERVAQMLGAADAFVLPSRIEPWGLVVNEAMAAGLPIVASDQVGAARDLVIPGKTGEVFPVGDADALAAALLRVLEPPGRAAGMGAAARQALLDWEQRYDIVRVVDQALQFVLSTPGVESAPAGSGA